MKTKYIITTVTFLILNLPLFADTHNITQSDVISVTNNYVDEMYEVWNVQGPVTDKPLIINYTIGTELNYDYVTINNVDNNGNVTSQIISISGTKSGKVFTTTPNGRVQVVFTTDESNCYASNPSLNSGINISFNVENISVNNSSLQVLGNAYFNNNVGVGTTAPVKRLEIWDGNAGRFTFSAASCNSGYEIAQTIDDTGYNLNVVSSTRNYNISTNGTVRLSISNTGNVGIGTTAPQAPLHLTNASTFNGENISAIFGASYTHWTNFGGNTSGRIRGSNSGYLVIGSNPNGRGDKNLYLNLDSPGDILMAYGGGKVGIGTSPTNRLDVAAVNGEGIRIGKVGDTGNLNVPLGSLSAQYNIDFTGYRDISVDQIGARISALRFNCHNPNSALIQKTGLAFFTNASGIYTGTTDLVERMRITPEGKVSIGTTNEDNTQGVLLTVNGTIHAKEVLVDLKAPLADFVFKPTYKLMPLNLVEQYVKTNKHLPEIPSAAEISKNGLSMGEMQNKLLQKVEELTLYVIEQQKQIERQSAKIKQLESKAQHK